MRYDNLRVYKIALDFCVYIETIVKSFEKYHKYSIGQDLKISFEAHIKHSNSYNLKEK